MVTSRPVIGVSALDALAAAAFESEAIEQARVCVWMDAARGEVFAAAYDAAGSRGGVPTLTALTDPEVDAPAAILERWRTIGVLPDPTAAPGSFAGDGAVRFAALLGGVPCVPVPALAPAIGRLARRMAGEGEHPPHALQPLYVRRPDAERAIRP
jgi:tRNA A37 threonylcarbamoyladenosine modification protein TsaB